MKKKVNNSKTKSKGAGIDIRFAKTGDYRKTLEKIIDTDKCPFCPNNFKYHKKPILKKLNGWLATENSWPYENTKHHFIFIPEAHKETFSDLTVEDFKTLRELIGWVIEKYKIEGGGVTMRFGDQKFTGATVHHLHLHLIVPEINGRLLNAKVVTFPIG